MVRHVETAAIKGEAVFSTNFKEQPIDLVSHVHGLAIRAKGESSRFILILTAFQDGQIGTQFVPGVYTSTIAIRNRVES